MKVMETGTNLLANALPEFANPPVVETILSVQFDPVPGIRNAHFGLFWKSLGPEWDSVSDAPKTDPQIEQFDELPNFLPMFGFKLGPEPSARLQIRNSDRSRMIQIDNGRLSYNWLAQTANKSPHYPHYSELRKAFDEVVEKFAAFVAAEKTGELRLVQWEVTYVNHLPKGSVWNTPADWARLFRSSLFTFPASTVPAKFESFNGSWHFELEPRRGRLHVELMHGRLSPINSEEILGLKLTARGPIKEGLPEFSLDSGMNLGHAIIVQSFAEMTSDDAHKFWRRTR